MIAERVIKDPDTERVDIILGVTEFDLTFSDHDGEASVPVERVKLLQKHINELMLIHKSQTTKGRKA